MNIPEFTPTDVQTHGVEIVCTDGIFIKQMLLPEAGILIPQHSHKYSHHSMLATGSVRAWRDGTLLGDFIAPKPIFIEAGCKHTFMSLEPNTIIYCIHNLHDEDAVEIVEHHALGG